MTWLAETPSVVVGALAAMMPRLEAWESYSRAQASAVAASIKPGRWAKKQLEDWRRTSEGGQSLKKAPGKRDLAGVGIGLKVVKCGR